MPAKIFHISHRPLLFVCVASLLCACAPLHSQKFSDGSDTALTSQAPSALAATEPSPKPLENEASATVEAADFYFNQLLLADIRNIYALKGNALTQKFAQLSEHDDPLSHIKLALALSRTHQVADSQRAMQILDKLLEHKDGSRHVWYFWGQLVYPLVQEQHKTNVQLSQQYRTIRENEQKIQSLTQKLNALQAIDESLSLRPSAVREASAAPNP